MRQRDEFTHRTRQILAQRVGCRCSVPWCRRLTTGPDLEEPGSRASVGRASHIRAAASGGPRYDQHQTPDERRAPENGIWLCAIHADLVDSSECLYPAETLELWKGMHERLIRSELEGLPGMTGWIHSVSARGLGPFRNWVSITLGHRTALIGENGTGKTLLMNQLACLSSRQRRKQWEDGPRWKIPAETSQTVIEVFGNDCDSLQMRCDRKGRLDYRVNDDRPPLFPNLGQVVLLGQDEVKLAWGPGDSVDVLSTIFDIDRADTRQLLSSRHFEAAGLVYEFEFADDELKARVFPDRPLVHWRSLSPYEIELVFMDLAIAVAGYFARRTPTVLIFDAVPASPERSIGGERLVQLLKKRPNSLQGLQVVFSGCAPELAAMLPVDEAYKLVRESGTTAVCKLNSFREGRIERKACQLERTE